MNDDPETGEDSTLVVWLAAVGMFASAWVTWSRRGAFRTVVTGETPLRRVVSLLEADENVRAHAQLAKRNAKAEEKLSDEDALELERLSHLPSVVALKRAKERLSTQPPDAGKKARVAAARNLVVVAALWTVSLALYWIGSATMAHPFDPYVILNVSRDASTADVRRVFRKLSMELHPDRLASASAATRDEAKRKFQQVAKAYKTLTDDEAMKNWLEHGHPDGQRAMHITTGIPRWMRDENNAAAVLAGYVVFVSVLGYGVMRWMYAAMEQAKAEAAAAEAADGLSVAGDEDAADELLRGELGDDNSATASRAGKKASKGKGGNTTSNNGGAAGGGRGGGGGGGGGGGSNNKNGKGTGKKSR